MPVRPSCAIGRGANEVVVGQAHPVGLPKR